MEEEARRILRAALAGHAAPHTDLARAIRERFARHSVAWILDCRSANRGVSRPGSIGGGLATTPAPAPGHLSVALSNPAYRVRQIIHASRSRTTPIRATHLAQPVRRHSPIQRSNPPTHSGFAQDGAGEAKCIHSGSTPYSSWYASTNAVMTWGGGRAPPG